jgi:hypothetical protein
LIGRLVILLRIQFAQNVKSQDDASFYRLMNELPPVLTSSEKYLYVLSPSRTDVEILDLKNLSSVKKRH